MNIFSSLYIIADGYFVANFTGQTEFAAVNLKFVPDASFVTEAVVPSALLIVSSTFLIPLPFTPSLAVPLIDD